MTATAWAVQALGYEFRDAGLLDQALTHRSAASAHNERLEFLGDAVLGLAVTEALYRQYPGATEGTLSRQRARLVRQECLEEVAREIGLGALLVLGSGELRTGGHHRGSILANALEAVIGAVYLDGGMSASTAVTDRLLAARLRALPADEDLRDPKTRLQELLQARGEPLPGYQVTSVEGPPHQQVFEVSCRVESAGLTVSGTGPSRRAAEQAAATRALLAMNADG